MNKVFKVIWSKVRCTWVVVSEIAKNHGAKGRSVHEGRKGISLLAGALLLGLLTGNIGGYAATSSKNLGYGNNYFWLSWDNEGHSFNLGSTSGLNNLPQYSITLGNIDTGHIGDYSIIAGDRAQGSANSIVFGYNAQAINGNSIVFGNNTSAAANGIIIGSGAKTYNANGIAIGAASADTEAAVAGDTYSIAIGTGSETNQGGSGNIAIGYRAHSSGGGDGVALGAFSAEDWRLNSGKIGYVPFLTDQYGQTDKTQAGNSNLQSALDTPIWNSTYGGVSIGDVTSEHKSRWVTRRLGGLAAGTDDTDAVNLAQLKASMTKIEAGDNISVNTTVNNDGSRTYKISSTGGSSGGGAHYVGFKKNSQWDSDSTQYGNYNGEGASAYKSSAMGINATATQEGATAVGNNATANGVSSVALGQNANTQQDGTVAVGHGAQATAAKAIAVGSAAKADGENSVHIGAFTNQYNVPGTVNGKNAVSIGSDSTATGEGATAYGAGTAASGKDAVALGQESQSTSNGTVAIGYQAKAGANNALHSTAIGTSAETNALEGTALGYLSKVTANKGLALGSGASAGAENSVALGAGSQVNNGDTVGTPSMDIKDTYGETSDSTTYNFAGTNPDGTVSLGYTQDGVDHTRTLTHVAAGRVSRTSTDAINGSQLYGVTQSIEKVEQNVARTATRYYSVNASDTKTGSNYLNDGAHGTNSLAAGNKAQAYGVGSLAIGYSSLAGSASNDDAIHSSMAIGPYAKAQGTGAIAFGNSSSSSGFGGVALGGGANVSSSGGVALGGTSSATAIGGVALGTESQANTKRGLTGYLSGSKKADQADSVWTSTIGAVSVGGGTFTTDSGEKKIYTRQITNLAAGTQDTDAVNVAQLKAVEEEGLSLTGNDNQKVTQSLGGNFNLTGGLTGDALKDGAASTANLGVRKNAAGGGLEVVMTTTPTFDTVTANRNISVTNSSTEAGTSDISISGTGLSMGTKKITGLAAGTDTTDAVNFGQLSAVSSDLSTFENETIQVGGNDGGTISRKLGENPILLQGTGTKTNEKYSGRNLKTHVDENGVLQILMDKELLEDRIDVGSALATPMDSRVNHPVVLGTDKNDATVGYVGINGRNGTSAVITAASDSAGTTRLTYTDEKGKTPVLATLDDGLTFGGDNSTQSTNTDVIARSLTAGTGNYLQIKGGADASNLTNNNIGVQADSSTGTISVKLAQELTDLTSAQFGAGVTVNGTGLTIGSGNSQVSLTGSGLNNGSQKVTNVKAGDISGTSTDAIIGSQLTNILNGDGSAKGISFGAENAAGSHTNPTSVAIGGTVTLKGAGGDTSHKNLNTQVTDMGELTVTMAPEIQENKIYVGTQISEKSSPTGRVNYPIILGENTVGTDTYGYVGIKGKNKSQLYLTADHDASGNTRLDYLDTQNNAHLVALTSDGYTFAGDTGTANTLALNSTLSITGGINDTGKLTTGNIGVVSSGNGGLTVELAKELTNLTSATFGSDANTTTITGSGVTAPAYKVGTNIYLDSNGLNANSQKVQNVQAGTLSDTSTDAVNGSQLYATNQKVTANTTSISNLTTQVADAGMTFAGDSGSTTKKLNSTLSLTGGETSADNLTLLTDKNVGIIADSSGNLEVRLAKALTDMKSATFVGNDFTSTVTGNGITIVPNSTTGTATGISLTKDNISMGNRAIDDVADGTVSASSKQAVNGSQLYTVKTTAEAAQTEAEKHSTVSVSDSNLNLTHKAETDTAGAAYDLKLNSTLTLGTGDNQIVLDGTDGGDTKIGKSITLNAGTGAIGATTLTTSGLITANGGVRVGDVSISPTTNTITGLHNTQFDQSNIISDRAATEGQLKSLVDQISAGTVTGGTTEVAEGSNTKVSSSTASKVTTYTVNVNDSLTHMKDATFETSSNGMVTGTSYLDSNGLILGASTDTTAARFTKNAISAGGQQVTKVGSGLQKVTDTSYLYDDTVAGKENYNNAASIGDVNSLINTYSQNLTTVNGSTGTGNLGLGATLDLKGRTLNSGETLNLTNDYTTANLVTKTEKGATSKDSTVTFYTKKDLVARSLNVGDIGSDGTVTTPAAKLYTQAISGTDSTLAGHLLLTGEARQGTGQSGYTSADFYVKDDVGSYLTDSNKPVTRVYYNDEAGIAYELANLKDGLHISGDNSTKADVELNKTLKLTGGATGTLTSGNIGVTATRTTSEDTDGYNAGLSIQLADTLTGLKSIGFAGSTVSIGQEGINAGGKKITNVQAGTEDTDAVNKKQLADAQAAATTELVAGSNVTIDTPTTPTDGHKVYTVNANFSGADVSGSNAVVYDNDKKNQVTLGGRGSTTPVKLTNLVDGDVSSTSTDAVTGRQLNEVLTYRNQTINVAGDTGSEVKLNHGNKLTVSGDPNISTSSSGSDTASNGTLQVSLANNVYLKGLHIGSNYPTHDATSVDSVALTADSTNQTGILTLRGDATHVSAYPRAQADISVFSADPDQTYMAAPFLQEVYQTSSSGTTTRNQPVRLAYRDNYNTAHQIATLDDGYIFSGDNGDKNLTEKLNGTVALRGMDNDHAAKITSETANTYLTKNNIGVVTKPKVMNEDGSTQDGQVQIRLAKDLTGLTSATFTNDNGDTAVIDAKNLKLTLNAQAEGKSPVSLTSSGLDNGNNQITHVAAGTADTDAVNYGQIKSIIGKDNHVKGLSFTGDTGSVTKHLGDTLQIFGGTDTDLSRNITTRVGDDGTLYVNLNRQLQLDGLHIGQKNSSVASLTTETVDLKDGTTSTYGMLSLKGVDQAQANITTTMGTTSLASSDPTTTTRLTYNNGNVGNAHEVAILEDGLRFTGDNYVAASGTTAGQNLVKKQLDQTLSITGGQKDMNALTALTDMNIGVVGDATNGTLNVQLSKSLHGLTDIYMGDTAAEASHLDKTGLYLSPTSSKDYKAKFTAKGISAGDQRIQNVADGTDTSDAATVGQLKEVESKASKATTLTVNHGQADGNLVLTHDVDKDGLHHTYDVALNKKVTVGGSEGDGQSITLDGIHNTINGGSYVQFGGQTSSTGGTDTSPLAIGWQSAGLQDVSTKENKGRQTGNYITGLSNTSWDPLNVGYSPSRAATEGQLRDVEKQVWENPITFLGNHDAGKTAEESQGIKATLGSQIRIIGTGTGEAGDFDASNLSVIAGKTTDGRSDALIIQMKKAPSFEAVHVGAPNNQGVYPVNVDGTGLRITNGPSITSSGIMAGDQRITSLASGGGKDAEGKPIYDLDKYGQNAANIQDVRNIANDAVNTAVGSFTIGGGKNIDVVHPQGTNQYTVALKDHVALGTDERGVDLDGTKGTIQAGSSTSGVRIDGNAGTIRAGESLTLDGNDGTISGLTNRTIDAPDFATNKGRAATEEQLKQVADSVSNLDKAASKTDFQLVGEKNQKGNYTGSYQVSDGNQVKLHVQDSMHPDQVKDITIDNVAKASDLENPITFLGNHDADKTAEESQGIKATLGSQIRIIGTGTGEAGDFDASNLSVIAGKTTDGRSDALIIQMKKAPSFEAVHVGAPNNQGVYPVNVDGTGLRITNGPSITSSGIMAGDQRITSLASGGGKDAEGKPIYDLDKYGQNAANIQDVRNIANDAVNTAVGSFTIGGGKNIDVVHPQGTNQYTVALKDHVALGTDERGVDLDGTKGTIQAGSSTSGVRIDGNAGTIRAGESLTLDGNNGTISGLTNRTIDALDFAKKGRAATEEQLKQVADNVSEIKKNNSDFQLVGEKDKEGNYTEDYKVSDDNKVKLHVQDSMHPDQVKDITIDNVAKASNLGDVSQISDDIQNKENNNVVGALNNLNQKVKEAANGSWESQIDGEMVKKVKAGDVQNFTSGDNIQLSNDNGAIQIATRKDVSFDKVTIGSGDSQMTLDKDGLQAGKVKVSTSEINAGGNRIQGVADGKEKDDAATVGQVAKVADAAGAAINTLGNHINRLDRRINKVGAGAAALAALHPDPNSDDDLSFSAGIGNYRGSTAAAIGAFYRPSDNVTVSMGATVGNGENMVNAGVTIGVGEGVGRNPSTRKDMIREISQLKEANAAKEAEVRDLKKQVQTLQKQNEDTQEKLKRIMEKLGI